MNSSGRLQGTPKEERVSQIGGGTDSPQTMESAKGTANNIRNSQMAFANDIAQGLIHEVRKLQTTLQERDRLIKDMEIGMADSEKEKELAQRYLRQKTISEEKLKEDNWNLEVANQDLQTNQSELNQTIAKLNVDHKKCLQDLRSSLEQVEIGKAQQEKAAATIDAMKARHDHEQQLLRRNNGILHRDMVQLKKQLEAANTDLKICRSKLAIKAAVDNNNNTTNISLQPSHGKSDDITGNGEDHASSDDGETIKNNMTANTSGLAAISQQRALEIDTLKQSLGHAHRMISSLRSNLQKEKVEKLELKKLLMDTQESVDQLQRNAANQDTSHTGQGQPKKNSGAHRTKVVRKRGAVGRKAMATTKAAHGFSGEDQHDFSALDSTLDSNGDIKHTNGVHIQADQDDFLSCDDDTSVDDSSSADEINNADSDSGGENDCHQLDLPFIGQGQSLDMELKLGGFDTPFKPLSSELEESFTKRHYVDKGVNTSVDFELVSRSTWQPVIMADSKNAITNGETIITHSNGIDRDHNDMETGENTSDPIHKVNDSQSEQSSSSTIPARYPLSQSTQALAKMAPLDSIHSPIPASSKANQSPQQIYSSAHLVNTDAHSNMSSQQEGMVTPLPGSPISSQQSTHSTNPAAQEELESPATRTEFKSQTIIPIIENAAINTIPSGNESHSIVPPANQIDNGAQSLASVTMQNSTGITHDDELISDSKQTPNTLSPASVSNDSLTIRKSGDAACQYSVTTVSSQSDISSTTPLVDNLEPVSVAPSGTDEQAITVAKEIKVNSIVTDIPMQVDSSAPTPADHLNKELERASTEPLETQANENKMNPIGTDIPTQLDSSTPTPAGNLDKELEPASVAPSGTDEQAITVAKENKVNSTVTGMPTQVDSSAPTPAGNLDKELEPASSAPLETQAIAATKENKVNSIVTIVPTQLDISSTTPPVDNLESATTAPSETGEQAITSTKENKVSSFVTDTPTQQESFSTSTPADNLDKELESASMAPLENDEQAITIIKENNVNSISTNAPTQLVTFSVSPHADNLDKAVHSPNVAPLKSDENNVDSNYGSVMAVASDVNGQEMIREGSSQSSTLVTKYDSHGTTTDTYNKTGPLNDSIISGNFQSDMDITNMMSRDEAEALIKAGIAEALEKERVESAARHQQNLSNNFVTLAEAEAMARERTDTALKKERDRTSTMLTKSQADIMARAYAEDALQENSDRRHSHDLATRTTTTTTSSFLAKVKITTSTHDESSVGHAPTQRRTSQPYMAPAPQPSTSTASTATTSSTSSRRSILSGLMKLQPSISTPAKTMKLRPSASTSSLRKTNTSTSSSSSSSKPPRTQRQMSNNALHQRYKATADQHLQPPASSGPSYGTVRITETSTYPRKPSSAHQQGHLRKPSLQSLSSSMSNKSGLLPPPSFGLPMGDGDLFQHSSAELISAITQTMIGEWMWKHTRKHMGGGISENKHKRFFWVHPYTRTLYWGTNEPGVDADEAKAKSAFIESVSSIPSSDTMGASPLSLLIKTAKRDLKLTAQSLERHELWRMSLSYLLVPPGEDYSAIDDVVQVDPYHHDNDTTTLATTGGSASTQTLPIAPTNATCINSTGDDTTKEISATQATEHDLHTDDDDSQNRIQSSDSSNSDDLDVEVSADAKPKTG